MKSDGRPNAPPVAPICLLAQLLRSQPRVQRGPPTAISPLVLIFSRVSSRIYFGFAPLPLISLSCIFYRAMLHLQAIFHGRELTDGGGSIRLGRRGPHTRNSGGRDELDAAESVRREVCVGVVRKWSNFVLYLKIPYSPLSFHPPLAQESHLVPQRRRVVSVTLLSCSGADHSGDAELMGQLGVRAATRDGMCWTSSSRVVTSFSGVERQRRPKLQPAASGASFGAATGCAGFWNWRASALRPAITGAAIGCVGCWN